jgi:putative ABC transport system permease protein
MFGYYVELAIRSFRRNIALTVLMVLAIAFGVGASMTTLTVLRVLSADPVPGKSDRLFYVQLDVGTLDGYKPGEEPQDQVTRADAEALLRDRRGTRQAMMTSGAAAIEPARDDLDPFFADGRWTSADFFPMFRVPFVAGGPWSAGAPRTTPRRPGSS